MTSERPPTDSVPAVAPDASEAGLELELISKICGNTTCPTIYRSSRGTLVVQGYTVSAAHAGVDLPQGEMLVEIPVELLTAVNEALASSR